MDAHFGFIKPELFSPLGFHRPLLFLVLHTPLHSLPRLYYEASFEVHHSGRHRSAHLE